jgi:hypothetical protein
MTCSGGVITFSGDGTINSIRLPTLRTKIMDHSHPLITPNRTNEASETLQLSNVSGTALSYRTAYTADGDGDGYRNLSWSRSHDHSVQGLATYQTSSTALTPSGSIVEMLKDDAAINCYTIDGYCPASVYNRLRTHTHNTSGSVASETLPQFHPTGTYIYFYTYDGSTWEWREVRTNAGAHGHTYGTLALAAADDLPAAPIGTIATGSPRIHWSKSSGNLAIKGRINGIGIGAMEDYYEDHEEHLTAGFTGYAGPFVSQLYCADTGTALTFDTSAGNQAGYIASTAQHRHSIDGYIWDVTTT